MSDWQYNPEYADEVGGRCERCGTELQYFHNDDGLDVAERCPRGCYEFWYDEEELAVVQSQKPSTLGN